MENRGETLFKKVENAMSLGITRGGEKDPRILQLF